MMSSGGMKNMDHFLDSLLQKRGSARENALSSISEGFMGNCKLKFAEKNFATILYRCLNSFKKGSSKESCLAAHVLGLLVITIGCGDNAHELYKESVALLSQTLKPGSDSAKLTSILDCIAIVTFVGGSDSMETQSSMQIIWQFIHLESKRNVIARNHLAAVQTAAISAWSLLLTSTDNWALNHTFWKGAISFFMNLLEANEEPVRVAADEALTLILEGGSLDKFSSDIKGTNDSSISEGNNMDSGHSSIRELKENMLNQVKSVFRRSKAENSVDEPVNAKCNSNWIFVKVLEDGCYPQTLMKIGKHHLKLSTCSQFLQVKFIKRLLGKGFDKHMLENEFLRDVFDFTPKAQKSGKEPYVSEREEATVRIFVPEVRRKDCKERIFKSHNSVFCKARTQLLNKQRVIRGKELWPSCD